MSRPRPDKNRLAYRRELERDDRFIISPVFPVGGLHLIAGDSGMGKSSWLLPILYDWSQGFAVMGGLMSYPCEWVYVALDRSIRDLNRTLRRLGLEDWDIPAYGIEELCTRDEQNKIVPPSLLDIHLTFPKAQLIVLEGLQALIPNTGRGQSQNKAESLWIIEQRDRIFNQGITVIATEHKPKSSDTGGRVRTSGLGSASLPGGCGTIVAFDYPESAKKEKTVAYTDDRIVYLSGHNFAPYSLEYTRDHVGRFVLQTIRSGTQTDIVSTDEDMFFQLDTQLSAWNADQTLPLLMMQSWADVHTVSKEKLGVWLRGRVSAGRLEMVRKGEYRKVRTI